MCIHNLSHALPPSSNLALMTNLVLHAHDHEYAHTHILMPMSHLTHMHPRPGAARMHTSPAFLYCFPVILFCLFLCIYIEYLCFKRPKKKGPELAAHETCRMTDLLSTLI